MRALSAIEELLRGGRQGEVSLFTIPLSKNIQYYHIIIVIILVLAENCGQIEVEYKDSVTNFVWSNLR